jgi:hypothetical protein
MTTITAPAPWDLPTGTTPALLMLGTYYGVPLSDIGEDGDVIALGHVGAYRMVAALRRHAREFYGEPFPFATTTLADVAGSIAHIWMVNTGPSNEDWWLKRVEPTEPGAFPVTFWTA